MDAAAIVKVIRVVDTRDYVEVGDRFVPVPGSGQIRQCDRCGRDHEVHAEVALAGGGTAVVGASCAKGSSVEKEVARRIDGAKARRQLEVRREAVRGNLERLTQIKTEVACSAMPAVEWIDVPRGTGRAAKIGDIVCAKWNTWQTDAGIELMARDGWTVAEMSKRYGAKVRIDMIFQLRNELAEIDHKIAKLAKKGM